MKRGLITLLLLYLLALHCSIALMELFSWLTFLTIVFVQIQRYRQEGHKPDWPLFQPVILLVGSVLISLLINPWLKPFWFQFGYMRWVFLMYAFYWALVEVWSERFERQLLRFWNVLIFVVGVYALAQCFFGIDLIRPGFQLVKFEEWGIYKETGYFAMKATAFFSLSLTFAYVLGISMMAVGGPSFASPLRRGALVARVAAVGGIFAAMSRGAWTALILCGLITAIRRFRGRFFIGSAVLFGLLVLGVAFVPWMHERALHLSQMKLDHSSTTRFDLWRAYSAMFFSHPWFGIGLLQGDLLLPEYYAKLGIVQPFVSHAHNVYLQWAAGAGIFALIAYFWLSLAMLRKAWLLNEAGSPWGWSLLLGQIFLHIGALTECNFFDAEVLHMMVFVWALTLAIEHMRKNPGLPKNSMKRA